MDAALRFTERRRWRQGFAVHLSGVQAPRCEADGLKTLSRSADRCRPS